MVLLDTSRDFLVLLGTSVLLKYRSTLVPPCLVRLKSPHTGENIQHTTECVLDRFDLKEKVYRVVTDNASSMVKAYKFGLFVDDDDDANDGGPSIGIESDAGADGLDGSCHYPEESEHW